MTMSSTTPSAAARSLGALPLVHAENGDVVARMQADLLARGVTGPEGHSYSRPPEVEGEAANRAIMIADMAGCPLYIVHVSCEQTHDAIRRAKQAGQRVWGEPLVQYLVLDDSEYQQQGLGLCGGPRDVAAFPQQEAPGYVVGGPAVGHAVGGGDRSLLLHNQAEAHRASRISRKIPNGTGGLEDRMPVLWNAGVNTGRLTKEEFVAATSANIARILNMYPKKGAVMAGSDADLVIWDPKATKKITAKNQVSRIEYNVFEGYECTGAPNTVLSRGRVAWEQGDMRAKPGDGDFVAREPNAPVHVANAIWKGIKQPQAGQARRGDAVEDRAGSWVRASP